MKTGLCVIFNHPFSDQLPLLRELYMPRFDRLLFLLPFDHSRPGEDVHVSYGGGYTFDSMLAGAADAILRRFAGFDSIVFLHNDALLNPALDGQTICQGLGNSAISCPPIKPIEGPLTDWQWSWRAAFQWQHSDSLLGFGSWGAKEFLPSNETAIAAAKRHGFSGTTTIEPAKQDVVEKLAAREHLFRSIHDALFGGRDHLDLGYPLFKGYSDMFAMPMAILPEWLRIMGILSALGLFPEVSIPTASILVAESIKSIKHKALWQSAREGAGITWAIDAWSDGAQFVHPIKINRLADAEIDQLRALYKKRDYNYCPVCDGICTA